jgi:WD40 repeat protein
MYKKILYVIVLSVLVLSACSPIAPVNTDPGKIVFRGAYTDNQYQGLYYLDPVGDPSVQTQLQNLYTPTWTFINPNGSQIITLSLFNGQENVTTLGIIDSVNPGDITELVIPRDILAPYVGSYGFNISFLGDKAYMEYDYGYKSDNGRHFTVYEITKNGLNKVVESVLTGDYFTASDNGDSPFISRVVLLPTSDATENITWLYNMESGKIDTLAKQLGDDPYVPSWSPDGSKYIYNTYFDEDHLNCWYLVKGKTPDQKLICLPSYWETGTGYGGGGYYDHAWSPDMKYVIVIMSEWANPERNIMYLINIEHKPKIVATIPINEGITGLAWSPNGKLLAYSVVNSDLSAIYTLSIDGTQNMLATAPNYQADDWIAPNGYPQLEVVGWLK